MTLSDLAKSQQVIAQRISHIKEIYQEAGDNLKRSSTFVKQKVLELESLIVAFTDNNQKYLNNPEKELRSTKSGYDQEIFNKVITSANELLTCIRDNLNALISTSSDEKYDVSTNENADEASGVVKGIVSGVEQAMRDVSLTDTSHDDILNSPFNWSKQVDLEFGTNATHSIPQNASDFIPGMNSERVANVAAPKEFKATGTKPKISAKENKNTVPNSTITKFNFLCNMFKREIEKVLQDKKLFSSIEVVDITHHKTETQWKNIDKIFNELTISDDISIRELDFCYEAHSEAFQDYRDAVELLVQVKNSILENLNTAKQMITPTAPNNEQNYGFKLPQVTLKSFDGKYAEWEEFKNMFTVLVEKQNVSDSVKLAHLKSSLTGSAQTVLGDIQIGSDSFKEAWQRIKEYYDNDRLLLADAIDKFLSIPSVKEDDSQGLKKMFNSVKQSLSTFKNLKMEFNTSEPLVVHIILKKLDNKTRENFEVSLESPKKFPSMKFLLDFMERRFNALDAAQSKQRTTVNLKPSHNLIKSSHNLVTDEKCTYCNAQHGLPQCEKFKAISTSQKWTFVKENKICCNCLYPGHYAYTCSNRSCGKCSRKHHGLLHIERKRGVRNQSDQKVSSKGQVAPQRGEVGILENKKQDKVSHSTTNNPEESVFLFLGTALVFVTNVNGKKVKCRALLDTCSQVSLISKSLCDRLNIPQQQKCGRIGTAGAHNSVHSNSRVNVQISSRISSYQTTLEAMVVPKITQYQPQEMIDISDWTNRKGIVLADPNFQCPESIDILLDGNTSMEVFLTGKLKPDPQADMPFLQNTELGWIVIGKYVRPSTIPHCGITTLEEYYLNNVPRLWDLDEPQNRRLLTNEEKLAEALFEDTVRIDEEGRFVVSLLMGKNPNVLGKSYNAAYKQFLSLERRLKRNPELARQYENDINEWISLGHMVVTEWSEIPEEHYFIPHHAVIKESSSTTKLRIVYNASCPTTSQISLNDIILNGPKDPKDVFDHVLAFRVPRFVMIADIAKMYRQIKVLPKEQFFQLIIWRDPKSGEILIYRITVVFFGCKSATYTTGKCLDKVADENKTKYPGASKALKENRYVDDVMTGENTLASALILQKQLIAMLSTRGFHLRKWCSNDLRLLKNIPKQDIELEWDLSTDKDYIKTLGIVWKPREDLFALSISDTQRNYDRVTKRVIASEAGQIFDPLGLVSPTTVLAKLNLQELWTCKIDWDDEVPEYLLQAWLKLRSQLGKLRRITIPRMIVTNYATKIQLHGFSDASEYAYGAVVYVRSKNNYGEKLTTLLCSRSKVSPTLKKSVAKLELCAAKMLAELMHRVKGDLNVKIEKYFYWTDSTIALTWIQNPSAKLKTFVANRVACIQELSDTSDWHHIPGNLNPADIVSRGMYPDELVSNSLWFNGPPFLAQHPSKWPNVKLETINDENAKQEFKPVCHVTVSHFQWINDIDHRNSFNFLKGVIARVISFSSKCKRQKSNLKDDLDTAEQIILRNLQSEFNLHKEIDKSLYALAPFVDNFGLIRVGGRISHSMLPFNSKHPILLPKSNIAKLIMTDLHKNHAHAGPQSLLAITRERFWPLNGKRLATQILHECVICFKLRPKGITQIMGDLPTDRVTASAPFNKTGVDFAGPIMAHQKGRGNKPYKTYLSVFVCFSTKAVHLEIVEDLSTDSFLKALSRFIHRRGKPSHIYSDNATNFVGAKEELKEFKTFFLANQPRMVDHSAREGITWSTIPPRSPHFGGLWEAAVKRAKFHLKALVNSQKLTILELQTFAIEVEALLNKRPLTPLSQHANDLRAITPADFLIQGDNSGLNETDLRTSHSNLITRWNVINDLRKELWTRWSKEYLHTLQQKSKWCSKKKSIEPGTVVLMKDSNVLKENWILGNVVNSITGKDGYVRVVDIQTKAGIKRRAISEICPLPIPTEASQETPVVTTVDSAEKSDGKKCDLTKVKSQNDLVSTIVPDISPIATRTRARSNSLPSLTTMLLTLLILPMFVNPNPIPTNDNNHQTQLLNNNVKIDTFNQHPGIYFDGINKINLVVSRWHFIAYFNLTKHFDKVNDLQNTLNSMKMLCKSTNVCTSLNDEFQFQIDETKAFRELLIKECHLRENPEAHHRAKRSYLDVVGNVAYSMFNILDSQYEDRMEEVIQKLNERQAKTVLLVQNHTTILETVVNNMKKDNEKIVEEFNLIHEQLNKNIDVAKVANRTRMYNTFANFLTLSLTRYRKDQQDLHQVLIEFKQKKVNPLIIPPVQFEEELSKIQGQLYMQYRLPSMRFEELESIVDVFVTATRSCLLFHIEIPLLSPNYFQLYKMLPLPTRVQDKQMYVNPITPYLGISIDSKEYYLMNEEDVNKCVNLRDFQICYENHPTYAIDYSNHCEIDLYLHSTTSHQHCDIRNTTSGQFWIQTSEVNKWLFSLHNQTTIQFLCKDDMWSTDIEGEGSLTIPPGCIIVSNSLKIRAQYVQTSTFNIRSRVSSRLPNVNMSIPETAAARLQPSVLKLSDMASVQQSIENVKLHQNIDLSNPWSMNHHDKISYGLIGFILLAGLFLLIVIKLKQLFCSLTPFNVPSNL